MAVLHLPALQRIFRTQPLGAAEWSFVFAIGLSVIVGGELDKWWNRRRARTLA